jgi:hypothetical protein
LSFIEFISVETLTIFLAIAAFVVGVWQYRKAQGWQRAEAIISASLWRVLKDACPASLASGRTKYARTLRHSGMN